MMQRLRTTPLLMAGAQQPSSALQGQKLLRRLAPRDLDFTVTQMEACVASHLGSTANAAAAKANAKTIKGIQRKISKLGPIPSAVDSDGDVLLESDDDQIEGEDPEAAKRAFLVAQLVPLNTDAVRIGKEMKKAASALYDFIGIAALTAFDFIVSENLTTNLSQKSYAEQARHLKAHSYSRMACSRTLRWVRCFS
jgi:hypothetical protein